MLHFFFGFHGRVRRTNFFFGALVTGLVASAFGLHWLHVNHIRWGWDYDAFEAVRWSMPPGFWLVGDDRGDRLSLGEARAHREALARHGRDRLAGPSVAHPGDRVSGLPAAVPASADARAQPVRPRSARRAGAGLKHDGIRRNRLIAESGFADLTLRLAARPRRPVRTRAGSSPSARRRRRPSSPAGRGRPGSSPRARRFRRARCRRSGKGPARRSG